MPRANRHYLPGHVWHITHRCHNGEFLLKLARDRQRWIQWLREARRRYRLSILDYMVTSNHVHLLLSDDAGEKAIPESLRLVAGRTAREYNERKGRRGAFWEDRYHATAVESGEHLARCVAYIDTNMIRAGVVENPGQWPFCGYREIQEPRQRISLVNREKLAELTGSGSVSQLRENHFSWLESGLAGACAARQPEWTASVAVGNRVFVDEVRHRLGQAVKGRKVEKTGDRYFLKENVIAYNGDSGCENIEIRHENTYLWR